jgi:hypothetical protein
MYNTNSIKRNVALSSNDIDRTLSAIESKFRDYFSTIRSRITREILIDIDSLKKSNVILMMKKDLDENARFTLLKGIENNIRDKIKDKTRIFRDEYSKVFKKWYEFLNVAESYYKPNIKENSVTFEEFSQAMSEFFDTINLGVPSYKNDSTEEEKERNREDSKNERLRFAEMINLKLKNNTNEGLKKLRDLEFNVKNIPEKYEKYLNEMDENISVIFDKLVDEKGAHTNTKNAQNGTKGVTEYGLVKKAKIGKGIEEAVAFLQNIRDLENYVSSDSEIGVKKAK